MDGCILSDLDISYQIVPASMDYLEDYKHYINECFDSGIDHYELDVLDATKSMQSIVDAANGKNLPEGWEPYETYFAVDGKTILGVTRLRLGTNAFIKKYIGHIGYETRPSEQGKGIAKSLLKFLLNHKVKGSAIVMCEHNNIGSRKVIESVPHQLIGDEEPVLYRNPDKRKYIVWAME